MAILQFFAGLGDKLVSAGILYIAVIAAAFFIYKATSKILDPGA